MDEYFTRLLKELMAERNQMLEGLESLDLAIQKVTAKLEQPEKRKISDLIDRIENRF